MSGYREHFDRPSITSLSSDDTSPTEGDTVTIICEADSRPVSVIKFLNVTSGNNTELSPTSQTDNTAKYQFKPIDCLHTGQYKCQADNEVGDVVVSTGTVDIVVTCPAEAYLIEPPSRQLGRPLSGSATFEVGLIAHPIQVSHITWSFTMMNASGIMSILPDGVTTALEGNVATLNVYNITVEHYGNYSVTVDNKVDGTLVETFALSAAGAPSPVAEFKSTGTTAVSISLQWVAGFNNGAPQMFYITYSNIQGGGPWTKVVPDTDVNQGYLVTYKLIDESTILPDQTYNVQLTIGNKYGDTTGPSATYTTEIQPTLDGDPGVAFTETEVTISWTLQHQDSVTDILVSVCVSGTTQCETQSVDPAVQQVTVPLPDPDAENFDITITMYDSGDVVNVIMLSRATPTAPGVGISMIIGIFLGVVLAVAVILVILWRKGIIPIKKMNQERNSTDGKSFEDLTITETSTNQQYEMASRPAQSTEVVTVYEQIVNDDINTFADSDVILEKILCDGMFYEVWNGKLVDSTSPPLQVVIKKLKVSSDIHSEYLLAQGLAMYKLRSNDNIIGCFGKTPGEMIILDNVPLGNLQQYLQAIAGNTYENIGPNQNIQQEMNFIHDIITGIVAVHGMQPAALFYSLSSSQVFLSEQRRCKLSGFSSAVSVIAREKWEESNQLPRPIQWLAPEAIKLRHVTQSDVWGLGVLMWEIINLGRKPLGNIDDNEARQQILGGQKPLKTERCSDELYDIMSRCWLHQPYNRPSIPDVQIQCLELCQYEPV